MTSDAIRKKAKAHLNETSRVITVQTLEKLDSLTLPSTPEFFELWYRYYEGHPDIRRAIDTLEGPVDEEICTELHTKFLSVAAQEGPIRKVNNEVQNSISSLMTKLKTATTATSEYGDVLGGVKVKIQKAVTIEDLGEVVTLLLNDTQAMANKNMELETELRTSSKEVEELKTYLDTVKKEATTDGLTEIGNRKAFDVAIATGVESATKNVTPLTLMLLDIDHFKKFNDTYGHPMGDQVLKLVARVLISNVKGQDTAARYGGEEFAVILPDTPIAAAAKVAETLRRAIETRELINKSTNTKFGSITISIGVAEMKMGEPVASLIERADVALYEAKNTGRNRICLAT